jgi:hypothetical protein
MGASSIAASDISNGNAWGEGESLLTDGSLEADKFSQTGKKKIDDD